MKPSTPTSGGSRIQSIFVMRMEDPLAQPITAQGHPRPHAACRLGVRNLMSGPLSGEFDVLHVSTRGEAPALGFADALLAGLARDGGLYVPQAWPTLTHDTIRGFSGQRYADVAKAVLGP